MTAVTTGRKAFDNLFTDKPSAKDPGGRHTDIIRVFLDTKHDAVCRKCGAAVQWAQVARTLKWVLFNRPVPTGGQTLDRDTSRPCEYLAHDDVHWNRCSAD